ncbi:hypothetical protein EVAR_74275_1 [Eumeta japonica]|uniref:Uncharacterized protein n=1 Tax=Eumeta variegata TaxID=151549 RepID=A0A4C1SCJ5_EUMVA|nr:hypothetical protein EVAR_74275_1 [Eumeta japonica]
MRRAKFFALRGGRAGKPINATPRQSSTRAGRRGRRRRLECYTRNIAVTSSLLPLGAARGVITRGSANNLAGRKSSANNGPLVTKVARGTPAGLRNILLRKKVLLQMNGTFSALASQNWRTLGNRETESSSERSQLWPHRIGELWGTEKQNQALNVLSLWPHRIAEIWGTENENQALNVLSLWSHRILEFWRTENGNQALNVPPD